MGRTCRVGWCVGSGGRVSCIGWFSRRLGQLLRHGVFATGAVRAEESCGRPARAGGLGRRVGKTGRRASRGRPAHAVSERRAGRAEIRRSYSVIMPHHVGLSQHASIPCHVLTSHHVMRVQTLLHCTKAELTLTLQESRVHICPAGLVL